MLSIEETDYASSAAPEHTLSVPEEGKEKRVAIVRGNAQSGNKTTEMGDTRQQEFCAIICCLALAFGFLLSALVAVYLLSRAASDDDNESTRLSTTGNGLGSEHPANPVEPTPQATAYATFLAERTTNAPLTTKQATTALSASQKTTTLSISQKTTMVSASQRTTSVPTASSPAPGTSSMLSTTMATMATTASLPKRSDQMPDTPLLCTVSSKFTAHSVIPEDGLCDFLFFESLYDEQHIVIYEPYPAGFEHFLQQGAQMKNTSLGVSFSPLNDTVFAEVGTSKFLAAIDHIWKRGVSHFGVLDVQGAYTTTRIQEDVLKLLQKLYHRVLQRVTPERPCYTVVASFCNGEKSRCPFILRDSSDIFQPSLYIAMSHMTIQEERRLGSRVWPLSMGDSPDNSSLSKLPNLAFANFIITIEVPDNRTRGAGSLTMRSRVYKPKVVTTMDEEEYSFYQPCHKRTYDLNVPPAVLCNSGFVPTIYNEDLRSIYTYNPTVNVTMVFESVLTIAEKLCFKWLFLDPEVYGLAVYDVEYDAEPAPCPQFNLTGGAFSRLKLIKNINDFYRRFGVISEEDHDKCLALANL